MKDDGEFRRPGRFFWRASSDKGGRDTRALLRKAAPVLVSLLLLAIALYQIRGGNLLESIKGLSPLLLVPLTLLVLARVLLVGLRWHLLLKALGYRGTWRASVRLTYGGAFLNSLLPGSIAGDPYRIYLITREAATEGRLSVSSAVSATLLDRFVGLFTLCLLCGLTAPFLLGFAGGGVALTSVLLVSVVVAVCCLLALGVFMLLTKYLPHESGGRVLQALSKLALDMTVLKSRPREVLALAALSILGHFCLAALPLLCLEALGVLATQDLPGLFALWAIAFAVALAQMMPFTMNGWGVREVAAVTGFGLLGIAPADALAASLATGAVNLIALLPAVFSLVRPSRAMAHAS